VVACEGKSVGNANKKKSRPYGVSLSGIYWRRDGDSNPG
jgi:hypothetical protein